VIELDFRQVLDTFADAVIAADGSGRIVYVNRAAEKLLGWHAAELVGHPLLAIIPARLHDVHRAGFQRYLTTRRAKLIGRPVRVPALRHDGTEVEIELTLSAFHVGEDEELFVGALRDLSDRVELERQLAVTRALGAATQAAAKLTSRLDLEHVLQTVVDTLVADFESALARIWLYDPATHTLHLRASAGLSRATAESSRAHIDVATYPYKVGEVARSRVPFVQSGLIGDPHFEQDWVRRERIASVAVFPLLIAGELRGVLVSFSRLPLREETVEVLGAFVAIVTASLNDVQLFHREQAARAEAEAASNVKTNFLRMVSHELRTPLTTLILQLQRLQREQDAFSARHQEIVHKISLATARLMALIDALLDYVRIQSGRLILQPETLDLAALAADAVEELRPQAEQKQLDLCLLPVPELPPLLSDPRLVRLILVNLVVNAIKYTEEGSIEVALAYQDGAHRLAVTDTGPGIPLEQQEVIFQPFEQLEQVQRKHLPGIGLGLALVKEMVGALDGHIQLRSEIGAGSTFTVILPLATGGTGCPPAGET
jgi:PAS domain S-box-containing protein